MKTSGNPRTRQRVALALKSSDAAWCEMVFLELQGSPQSRQNRAISLLEPTIPMLHISTDCWARANELAKRCHHSGHPVPNTDALIYATAETYDCAVLHNDKHFEWLDKITGRTISVEPALHP
ncbi:MAG: PIN domain-containing protein [Verrucomicrobia bacterium]|nr:PIN domain-containing protein [Verrucomicrobiota bacterium]